MTLVAPDHIDSGTGRLLARVSAAEQGAISGKYPFDPGDVVYSKIRPYLRKVVRPDFRGLSSADMYPLRAGDGLDSGFLLHALLGEHFSRFAEIVSMRSGFPKINRGEFAEYTAALPTLREQRRIAEILDTVDDAIRETEEIIGKLKQVKQGLLHDLLTRGIDGNGELRDPDRHPAQFKDSPLGRIPKAWDVVQLAEVYAERSKNGLYKPAKYHGHGPLMVQMGNIFRGLEVSLAGAGRVAVSPSELVNYGLRDGDLLFGRRSLVLEGAGKCALVRSLPEPATFESSIVRVRLVESRVVPLFAALYLASAGAAADRRRFIRQVAVSGVSSADIAEFALPAPPLHEQRWLCERVEAVNDRIEKEEATRENWSLAKQGLMEDLLTGRVRVTALLEEAAE